MHSRPFIKSYLDHASATPVSARAKGVLREALRSFGNPSSTHAQGVSAKDVLENAREIVARVTHSKSEHVLFTSCASESNTLAIQGSVRALVKAGRDIQTIKLFYLDGSHSSITKNMEELKSQGVQVESISSLGGRIDLEELTSKVDEHTALVALERVCGETGALYDTKTASKIIKQQSKGKALVLVDASQAPRVEILDWTRLGADYLSLDAQKIGGVRGAGILVKNTTALLSPILLGGGQELGMRSGTEATALIAACATALSEVEKGRERFVKKTRALRALLLSLLTKAKVSYEVNEGKEQAPHIVNISLTDVDTEYLSFLMSSRGVYVSTKSSCDSGEEVSRAVFAHTDDRARASATIRFSFGPNTFPHHIWYGVRVLAESLPLAKLTK